MATDGLSQLHFLVIISSRELSVGSHCCEAAHAFSTSFTPGEIMASVMLSSGPQRWARRRHRRPQEDFPQSQPVAMGLQLAEEGERWGVTAEGAVPHSG